jgi:hypothetical protein
MKHSIVNHIPSKDETKRSYSIEVIKMDGQFETDRFRIPFVHAGDGAAERGYCNTSIKASRGASKYMKPSFSVIGKSYQVSQKREGNI